MPARLVCPVEGKTFVIRSRTREELEGRTIKCPLCHQVHDAVPAPVEDGAASGAGGGGPAEGSAVAPGKRLYPVGGVTLATFIGSCLGGGIVMAINHARLGRSGKAWGAALLGLLATVALLLVGMRLPDKVPGVVLWLPALALYHVAAQRAFGAEVEAFRKAGGTPASLWGAAGIGVAALAVIGIGVFVYLGMDSPFPGGNVEIGKDDVYYAGEATEADARKLADELKTLGYFGHDGATAALEMHGATVTLSLVVRDGVWNDPVMRQAVREVGASLTQRGFGPPLTIRMCDDTGATRHEQTLD